MTVGESHLIKADGSGDPFPCDGTLPDCVGEHDGSVVVEGPSAVNMAAPLVCDVETGEYLSDLASSLTVASAGLALARTERAHAIMDIVVTDAKYIVLPRPLPGRPQQPLLPLGLVRPKLSRTVIGFYEWDIHGLIIKPLKHLV